MLTFENCVGSGWQECDYFSEWELKGSNAKLASEASGLLLTESLGRLLKGYL